MSDVTPFATGRASSTSLIEDEMEAAGQIDRAERDAMHWRAGAETQAHALRRMKGEAGADGPVAHGTKSVANDAGKAALRHFALEGFGVESLAEAPAAIGKALIEIEEVVVVQAVDCAEMYYMAIRDGAMLHARANEEAVEVVALLTLDVDPAFRDARLAHHENIVATRTMTRLLGSDGELTPHGRYFAQRLQAAADSGGRAAIAAMALGKDAYLAERPDLARRLAVDVAFSVGFENAMSLRGNTRALVELRDRIDARNPWTVAELEVRG
jgi:hypothetical protein